MASHLRLTLSNGREIALVPWTHVQRELDMERARALLRAAAETKEGLRELRSLVADEGLPEGDVERMIERASQRLADGEWVLVLEPEELHGLSPIVSPAFDADDDIRPLSDLVDPEESTWIEVRCVGVAGAAYAGAPVRVGLPDGATIERKLDGSSSIRIDAIEGGGRCTLELSLDAKRSGTIPIQERTRVDGREPRLRRGGPAIALSTGVQHVVVVEGKHGFSC
jgi:hypothetical protein